MLSAIFSILIVLGVIVLALYVLETYFPTIHRIVKAMIIAAVIGAVLGLLRSFICRVLCGV
jgi:hypothetical protein